MTAAAKSSAGLIAAATTEQDARYQSDAWDALIERWLVLTDGLGLDREYVIWMEGALPASRFATEAYVRFVAEHTNLEAIASSLTELFAPSIHKERISGMLENYEFIGDEEANRLRSEALREPWRI